MKVHGVTSAKPLEGRPHPTLSVGKINNLLLNKQHRRPRRTDGVLALRQSLVSAALNLAWVSGEACGQEGGSQTGNVSVCLVAQSCPTLAVPGTAACQVPLSMGFSRQEYWSGLPFPPPGDLIDLGIEPCDKCLETWPPGLEAGLGDRGLHPRKALCKPLTSFTSDGSRNQHQ